MATPAQTQVTLDASQFIAAVDHIGNAITAMNANLASAGASFNQFAASGSNMETSLKQISASMIANVAASNATTAAVRQLTSVQNSMQSVMTQVAISTRAAAQSLDQLANSSTRASQTGVKAAQSFTFAWDGILRLLTITTIRRIFLDIAASMREAIAASAQFTEKVGLILAVNQNLGTNVEGLSKTFANLSVAFNRPLAEVANAGLQAVQSGVAQTGQQIDQVTSAVGRLSEVTGTTMPQAMTATIAVLRAFKLDASEAQNVTNQLFHMMQSGIGVNEIGSSIGRVSAQAERLGINFSELGLFMEKIKATGVSDTEVMTQVGAVLNSLERPTARLQALLGEHGFFTPQQLVQAQRLHGALQLINQDISEGNINARQALQSRRAGGGLSVAEDFAQSSGNNPLNNVSALQQGSETALRMVNSTQRWGSELQKIKTIFESEVAPGIIKSILDIFEPMGGLAKVVTDAGRQIATLIDPVTRVISVFALWGGAIERLAEAMGVLNAANRINTETMRRFVDAAREGGERLNTWVSTQRQAARASLEAGTQTIANHFAPINTELNRQSELQRERVHNLAEQIDATSKSVFSGFAAQIESLEGAARHAESRISESLKRVAEFGDKTDKDAFEHRLKTTGDVNQVSRFTSSLQANNAYSLLVAQGRGADNQINLIRSRRQRLVQEIEQLQAKGDADSIAAARRRFDQLRQLNDQENDIRGASAKRGAEFDARASGGDQTYNPYNREREEGARRLNAAEQAFEEANRRRLAGQQQILEGINHQLRERLRLAQDGQRDVGRLTQQLLTPQGLPRQDFQGVTGGQHGSELINRTIDNEISRLRELPQAIERGIQEALSRGAITPEQADQARRRAPGQDEILRLIQQLEQQRTATQGVFTGAEARRVSEENQRRQIALLASIEQNTSQAINRVAETREEQRSLLQRAQEQINALRTAVPRNFAVNGEVTPQDIEASRIATALRSAIVDADRQVRTAARTGDAGDVQRAEAAIRTVTELSTQLTSTQRERGAPGLNSTSLENILSQLRDTLQNRAIREAALQTEQQTAPIVIQGVIDALRSLETSTNTASGRIAEALQNPNHSASAGGDFASGGLIGNMFSNYGPDDTRINAKRGEFVVNPDSTRKFYATLVAINRGDSPRGGGYAHGGTVTSTIGNMHFHVNGAEHPEQTARSVMKIIRREQRRGNV